jgi:hypothetical protein
MRRASRAALNAYDPAAPLDGFERRSDAKTWKFPNRFMDERGEGLWNVMVEKIDETRQREFA